MTVRVNRAYLSVGSLNAMTPLLTASIPVMAVQPLAKARSKSHAPTAAVAEANFGGATTGTGWPPARIALTSPIAIIPSRQAINK